METYYLLAENKDKGIKQLFELYSKGLYGYASRKWGMEEDEVWDLIYKSFYKAADQVATHTFENEQRFAGFVFKIFINKLRDHVRTRKRQEILQRTELSENIESPEAIQEEASEPLKALQHELDKLEDWQRILLLMRSQDVAYKEIARYVNKPEEQLKTYYARLKKQLTEKLNPAKNEKNENASSQI